MVGRDYTVGKSEGAQDNRLGLEKGGFLNLVCAFAQIVRFWVLGVFAGVRLLVYALKRGSW